MTLDARFTERGRCNCGALRKASRRLSQIYDSALAPVDLKATQYAIVSEIEFRGDNPPTIGDLANALVMDQSTVGQNLRPLERDGLIALQEDATDRRRRHVNLTSEGRARLAAARPLWIEAQARFETFLGEQQAATLRATLLSVAHDPALNRDVVAQ